VEMALCEWLQMQEPDFYHDRTFKSVPMQKTSLHFTNVLKNNDTLME
jgi:hypothetical protein